MSPCWVSTITPPHVPDPALYFTQHHTSSLFTLQQSFLSWRWWTARLPQWPCSGLLHTHIFPPWLITLGLGGSKPVMNNFWMCGISFTQGPSINMMPWARCPRLLCVTWGRLMSWWTFPLRVQGKLRGTTEGSHRERLEFQRIIWQLRMNGGNQLQMLLGQSSAYYYNNNKNTVMYMSADLYIWMIPELLQTHTTWLMTPILQSTSSLWWYYYCYVLLSSVHRQSSRLYWSWSRDRGSSAAPGQLQKRSTIKNTVLF